MFLGYLQDSGYSEPTLRDWTPALTKRFADDELSRCKASTVRRRLWTLKVFSDNIRKHIDFPCPFDGVRFPSVQEVLPGRLTDEQLEAVLETAWTVGNTTYQQHRNFAAVSTLLETALRASELLSIRGHQVDMLENAIHSIRTKQTKFVTKHITKRLAVVFQSYLPARVNALARVGALEHQSCPLFVSFYQYQPTKPESFTWSYASLSHMLDRIKEVTGINVHAHLFRHTAAHRLFERTRDIRLVQRHLNHSDIKTSLQYLKTTDDELIRALDK